MFFFIFQMQVARTPVGYRNNERMWNLLQSYDWLRVFFSCVSSSLATYICLLAFDLYLRRDAVHPSTMHGTPRLFGEWTVAPRRGS